MSMMKAISWIIIVLLGALYSYVFYLARNPDVSSLYRAYYIDRTTTIPPHDYENFRLYRPGARVDHMGSDNMLFEGWSRPEKNHRWSKGSRSELVFVTEEPESFRGDLYLQAFYHGTQRVEIAVNNVPVGTFEGNRRKSRQLIHFDPQLLVAGSPNRIQFHFPDASAPRNQDSRILAMALVTVRVE